MYPTRATIMINDIIIFVYQILENDPDKLPPKLQKAQMNILEDKECSHTYWRPYLYNKKTMLCTDIGKAGACNVSTITDNLPFHPSF